MNQFNNEMMPEQNKSDSLRHPHQQQREGDQAIQKLEEMLKDGNIDRKGFNQLIGHYYDFIFRHFKARCLGRFNIYDEQLIEDLFHDALNNIWKKVDEKTKIKSLEAYFKTTAKNILIDYIKKQKHGLKANYSLDNIQKEPVSDNGADYFFLADLNKLLTSIASELEKQIYIMYLKGYSYELIQMELGCSHSKIASSIFSINKWLRENFKLIDEILIGSCHP